MELEQTGDDKIKRGIAWVTAPFYIVLVLSLLIVTIVKAFNINDTWASELLDYFSNLFKGVMLMMALIGIWFAWPKMVNSLNREKKLPLPGLTWITNPLYSEYYESQVPSENVNDLIEEGKKLKEERDNYIELLNYCGELGSTHVRTLANIQKLHKSLRNRLFEAKGDNIDISDFLNEVAIEICSSLMDDTGDKSCSIMLIENEELKIWGQNRIEPDSIKLTTFKRGNGFAGSIWQNGRPEIVDDINSDPRFGGRGGIKYYNSIIGIPILFWGDIIGVICVQSQKNSSFSQEDAGILKSFSELIILALTIGKIISMNQEAYQEIASAYEYNENNYRQEEGDYNV